MERDYKKEHARRTARQGRLVADVDRELLGEFKKRLGDRGLAFAQWLRLRILDEIDKDRD